MMLFEFCTHIAACRKSCVITCMLDPYVGYFTILTITCAWFYVVDSSNAPQVCPSRCGQEMLSLPAVGIENYLGQVWHPVKWCESYSDLYIFDNLTMAAFVGYFYLCLSAYPKADFVIHKINPEYRPTDCWIFSSSVFVTFLRLDLQATMLT